MKEPIDPSKTIAYNHYPIDGDKPVLSNGKFKEALEMLDNVRARLFELKKYAMDSTQKNLIEEYKKDICGLS